MQAIIRVGRVSGASARLLLSLRCRSSRYTQVGVHSAVGAELPALILRDRDVREGGAGGCCHGQRDGDVGANFHASITRGPTGATLAVAKANASTLATSIALVNEIKAVYNTHVRDKSAHNSVFSAAITTADATDLASAITLANAIKAAYNTGGHINTASVHFNADATNTVAAANASDQSSLNTLLNELKTDLNAHIANGLAGDHIEFVDA